MMEEIVKRYASKIMRKRARNIAYVAKRMEEIADMIDCIESEIEQDAESLKRAQEFLANPLSVAGGEPHSEKRKEGRDE